MLRSVIISSKVALQMAHTRALDLACGEDGLVSLSFCQRPVAHYVHGGRRCMQGGSITHL